MTGGISSKVGVQPRWGHGELGSVGHGATTAGSLWGAQLGRQSQATALVSPSPSLGSAEPWGWPTLGGLGWSWKGYGLPVVCGVVCRGAGGMLSAGTVPTRERRCEEA